MHCLYCGKGIGPIRQLRDLEFCSAAHRTEFRERYRRQAYEALSPEPAPVRTAEFMERPAVARSPAPCAVLHALPAPKCDEDQGELRSPAPARVPARQAGCLRHEILCHAQTGSPVVYEAPGIRKIAVVLPKPTPAVLQAGRGRPAQAWTPAPQGGRAVRSCAVLWTLRVAHMFNPVFRAELLYNAGLICQKRARRKTPWCFIKRRSRPIRSSVKRC